MIRKRIKKAVSIATASLMAFSLAVDIPFHNADFGITASAFEGIRCYEGDYALDGNPSTYLDLEADNETSIIFEITSGASFDSFVLEELQMIDYGPSLLVYELFGADVYNEIQYGGGYPIDYGYIDVTEDNREYEVTLRDIPENDFSCYKLTLSGDTQMRLGELSLNCSHSPADDGTVIQEAICTEQGIKQYECIYCHESYTEGTEALGHSYDNGVCTRCETLSDIAITADDGSELTSADYEYSGGVLIIKTDKPVTLSNRNPDIASSESVLVADGIAANITLNGINIDVSGEEGKCAFEIANNSPANVTITLADGSENIVKSGSGRAGIHKTWAGDEYQPGELTINGTGSLKAVGGYSGAGIGGSETDFITAGLSNGSRITIEDGNITAIGGSGGAGIGGGYGGQGSYITISGGTVTAQGGYMAAGIGGGQNHTGFDIYITGGTVTANGGESYSTDAYAIGSAAGLSYGKTDSDFGISGGVLTISGKIDTFFSLDGIDTIIIDTDDGTATVYGNPVITDDFTLPEGYTLVIPESSTVTVAEGATFTNNGTVTNNGTLENNGTVANSGNIINNGEVEDNGEIIGDQPYAEAGDFVITGGTKGTDYTYENGVLTIKKATPLTIKNTDPSTPTTDRIVVADDVSANITLAGVNIDVSSQSDTAAFKIADNSTGNVTITLADGTTNTLKSGSGCAGLQKNGEYSDSIGELTITGTGSLTAQGGNYGAGIGGGDSGTGLNITISGGNVNATGGFSSAGIGGGLYGTGSDITISNSIVCVTAGSEASSIGSGAYNSVGPADLSNTQNSIIIDNTAQTVTVYGDVTLTEDLEVPAGYTMTIPEGASLTVGADVTLTNNGSVENNGTLINNGELANNSEFLNNGEISGTGEINGNTAIKTVVEAPEADDTVFTYKGTEQIYEIAESDFYTVTGNKQTNAGDHTVTVVLKENCIWSDGTTEDITYTFTIAKAALTVTAESYTVKLGNPFPETFEYTVTDLKGTDTIDSIGANVAVSYAGASVPAEVGEYVITASGEAETENYTITYVNGKLTITAKDVQTITASDVTLSYSDTDGKITATTDGDGAISYEVATGEDVISVDTDGNITALKAGTATVTVKAAETADYAAAEKMITVTVTDCEHKEVETKWYKDKDYHWHKCGKCTAELDKAEHTFSEWLIVNEATKESDGTRMRGCTVCGYEQSESIEYVPDGEVDNATNPENNACHADLELTDEEIIDKIPLTPEEKAEIANGADLTVYMVVIDYSGKVPTEDKALAEAALTDGMNIGMYIDVTLFKQIGDNSPKPVTETNGELKITFEMPEKLINGDENVTREYSIVRVHSGKADILSCGFDSAIGKSTFSTDCFSTYAIAYNDTENTTEAPEYYPIIKIANVHSDKTTAAAGETVNVETAFGYDIIVTDASGRRIAQITEKGSFVMPASKVYVKAVQNETLALMANAWRNSYIFSYDSDMNKIKVNSTKKRGIIVIDLGEEYAGKAFTIYNGRKNTSMKVDEGVLDAKGRFTFEVPDGKNYTLVVED